MKISKVEFQRYDIPFIKPVVISGNSLSVRSGVIVKVESSSGFSACGEIAPLPFYHDESLEAALAQALELRDAVSRLEFPDGAACMDDLSPDFFPPHPLHPSVQIGFDTAFENLMLYSAANEKCAGIRDADSSIPVNALFPIDAENFRTEILRLLNSGYSSIKIKVGIKPLEYETERIIEIKELCLGKALLRLDANGRWPLGEALDFARGIRGASGIEYIEEPVKDEAGRRAFHEKTGIPVALDESLKTASSDADMAGVRAFIIKPSVWGSFRKASELINAALGKNITPVISSCFETGIAISSYARFAYRSGLRDVPHGLDTLGFLEKDIVAVDMIESGRLFFNRAQVQQG